LCTLPHPNGGGTACPVLPRPRTTGHRLAWRVRPSTLPLRTGRPSRPAPIQLQYMCCSAAVYQLGMPMSGDTGDRGTEGGGRMVATSQRRRRRRRRGVLRLQHQHHLTSPAARRCVCQAVCGQVDGLSFFCAGQSGAKNNVSRHRAIAHIAGGWYGVVRCDRPPPRRPPPPVQGGAHTTHRGAAHCQLWRRHGASQLSPGLPREMRWPLGPSACSPSLLLHRACCYPA